MTAPVQGYDHMCFWAEAFGRLDCAYHLCVPCTGSYGSYQSRLVQHHVCTREMVSLCVCNDIKRQEEAVCRSSCMQL